MTAVFASARLFATTALACLFWLPLAAAAPTLEQAFRASDVVKRLQDLSTEITHVVDLGGGDLVAADYVPKQGALSEWDDESRVVLYHQETNGAFTRVQFVSKAGRSVPGRLAALVAVDLDHDGTPEVLAIGWPHTPSGKVTSQIFHRRPGKRFEALWQRKDRGACFILGAREAPLIYITLDPITYAPHREAFSLNDDQLVSAPTRRTP